MAFFESEKVKQKFQLLKHVFFCADSVASVWLTCRIQSVSKNCSSETFFSSCCCCSVTSVLSDSVWPHRQQPTRLPLPWDSPGKNTGVGCQFLLQCMKVKVKSLSHVQLFATPWTAAYQAPPPMGFSRQEYWSRLPLLSLLVGNIVYSASRKNITQSQRIGMYLVPWEPRDLM